MNTISQSVLSTNLVQVPITIKSPAGYDPTGDAVQFAFPPLTYPPTSPVTWFTGSWVTFPGPVYWAQCLVGPANGGAPLAQGQYQAWVKITDNPEIPVLQPFVLEITP